MIGDLFPYIPTLVLAALLWRAERAWQIERSKLLDRIQAPKVAEILAAPEPTGDELYVGFDDDEGYHRYRDDIASGELNG